MRKAEKRQFLCDEKLGDRCIKQCETCKEAEKCQRQRPALLFGGVDQQTEIPHDGLSNEFEVHQLPSERTKVLIHKPPVSPLDADQCCALAAWLVHCCDAGDAKTRFNRKLRLLKLLDRRK